MINSDVLNVYLGLLVDKCRFSQTRLGVVATNFAFVEVLKNPCFSWAEAQRYLRDHPIDFIPTFIGGCHWAAVIVDSTLSSARRKCLYFDSIIYFREGGFKNVEEWFRDWENDSPNFVVMDWPEQAVGSNDCAVFTLAACAYYVLRAGNLLPSSFEFNTDINAAEFGRGWRRHVHKSIVNQRIDLGDDVFWLDGGES